MNTISTVAENNVVRYFPFCNGKYIGNMLYGYASIEDARAALTVAIPADVIYKKYFGSRDEYERTYFYLDKIDAERVACCPFNCVNPETHEYNTEFKAPKVVRSKRVYSTKLRCDKETLLKEIDAINIQKLPVEADRINLAIEFEKKYGLYPAIYPDYSYFNEAYNKYIEENVEFRTGIIEISVKWEDGTVTPSPLK